MKAVAERETREETGVTFENLRAIAVVDVINEVEGKRQQRRLYVFTGAFSGTPRPSDELPKVGLYPIQDLPFDEMWPDARHWLPIVLNVMDVQAMRCKQHYKGNQLVRGEQRFVKRMRPLPGDPLPIC